MTRAVPTNTYKRMQRDVADYAAKVAALRREGLAKISARRNTIVREDACSAYMDARFWLREFRNRLAAVHPEKNCHLSPAAKRRHEMRHGQL